MLLLRNGKTEHPAANPQLISILLVEAYPGTAVLGWVRQLVTNAVPFLP
ncbi:hypothetical protein [Ectobacillus ponti]|uniref:Uncharacterized protein n=1 Tax=Ectobacillus ponti TaxID=2961894 RepID=A0AA41XB21_9BACI|nr:hypothetical protein [Ectobacillus ponti]MCP8970413.1 hypothetical protein [Ectobacillus ponti]